MRTEHDLDEMLAEHGRRFDPEHRPDLPPAEPRPPRTTWPRNLAVKFWRPSDQAELAHWVKRLYHDQGLTIAATAEALRIGAVTISREVHRQGLLRAPSKAGVEERRERARAIYREHHGLITGKALAKLVGVSESAALAYIRDIRDEIERPDGPVLRDPKLERTVDRALTSMTDMAELLSTIHLHGLAPDTETAARWERQIRQINKVVNSVRRHAKGESHAE